jgi:hypothetical protein
VDRKRVNISIDPETYERLQELKRKYGFKNACELVVAFVHILLDRTEAAGRRRYDLPDEDGQYIDGMFEDLGNYEKTPANTNPPKQRRNRTKKD